MTYCQKLRPQHSGRLGSEAVHVPAAGVALPARRTPRKL